MSNDHHSDASSKWLTFFLVCFAITMAIGMIPVFNADIRNPDTAPAPSAGGGH